MKKLFVILCLLEGLFILLQPPSQGQPTQWMASSQNEQGIPVEGEPDLEKAVWTILDTKCNVCHRKQNPFRVFKLKKLNKYAPKIMEQVFVKKRMPKGEEIKLTLSEKNTLSEWLQSKNLSYGTLN